MVVQESDGDVFVCMLNNLLIFVNADLENFSLDSPISAIYARNLGTIATTFYSVAFVKLLCEIIDQNWKKDVVDNQPKLIQLVKENDKITKLSPTTFDYARSAIQKLNNGENRLTFILDEVLDGIPEPKLLNNIIGSDYKIRDIKDDGRLSYYFKRNVLRTLDILCVSMGTNSRFQNLIESAGSRSGQENAPFCYLQSSFPPTIPESLGIKIPSGMNDKVKSVLTFCFKNSRPLLVELAGAVLMAKQELAERDPQDDPLQYLDGFFSELNSKVVEVKSKIKSTKSGQEAHLMMFYYAAYDEGIRDNGSFVVCHFPVYQHYHSNDECTDLIRICSNADILKSKTCRFPNIDTDALLTLSVGGGHQSLPCFFAIKNDAAIPSNVIDMYNVVIEKRNHPLGFLRMVGFA